MPAVLWWWWVQIVRKLKQLNATHNRKLFLLETSFAQKHICPYISPTRKKYSAREPAVMSTALCQQCGCCTGMACTNFTFEPRHVCAAVPINATPKLDLCCTPWSHQVPILRGRPPWLGWPTDHDPPVCNFACGKAIQHPSQGQCPAVFNSSHSQQLKILSDRIPNFQPLHSLTWSGYFILKGHSPIDCLLDCSMTMILQFHRLCQPKWCLTGVLS